MKRVFIASPYAATADRSILFHELYARDCMMNALLRGEHPFAPHLLYTQVLLDSNPAHRTAGLAAGMSWLRASQLLAVYEDYGISNGMQKEIDYARKNRMPIEYRKIRSGA